MIFFYHYEVGSILGPVRGKTSSSLASLIFVFLPLQVTVKLYRRGSQGWLGKSINATTTIPSNTFVIFRISGEEADTKIPADTIHSVTLSM